MYSKAAALVSRIAVCYGEEMGEVLDVAVDVAVDVTVEVTVEGRSVP